MGLWFSIREDGAKNKPTPFFIYHFLDKRMGVSHIQSFRELQEAGAKKKNPFFVHELSIGFDKQFDDQSGKGGGGGGGGFEKKKKKKKKKNIFLFLRR